MTAIDESLLHEIVQRILTVAKPEKIILFGSAASNTMNRDSDIDLLVLERERGNTTTESVVIRTSLRGPRSRRHVPRVAFAVCQRRWQVALS